MRILRLLLKRMVCLNVCSDHPGKKAGLLEIFVVIVWGYILMRQTSKRGPPHLSFMLEYSSGFQCSVYQCSRRMISSIYFCIPSCISGFCRPRLCLLAL